MFHVSLSTFRAYFLSSAKTIFLYLILSRIILYYNSSCSYSRVRTPPSTATTPTTYSPNTLLNSYFRLFLKSEISCRRGDALQSFRQEGLVVLNCSEGSYKIEGSRLAYFVGRESPSLFFFSLKAALFFTFANSALFLPSVHLSWNSVVLVLRGTRDSKLMLLSSSLDYELLIENGRTILVN